MHLFERGRIIILVACFSSACSPHLASSRAETIPLTKDEVIEGLVQYSKQWHELDSWMIKYRNERENVEPAPGSEIHWPPALIVNARNRKGWIYGYEEQDTLDGKFKQKEWFNWKDNVCLDRQGRSVSILPEPTSNIFNYFYYPALLGLNIFSDLRWRSPILVRLLGSERGSDLYPDALTNCVVKHKSSYILRPKRELIDNSLCYVLERPQHDIIWIDPSVGFVLRKRIRYTKKQSLASIVKNEDFKDFGDGLWLPQLQHTWKYNPPNVPDKFRGKIASHNTNKVVELRVNDLKDTFFDVPIPDDAMIHDTIRGVSYQRRSLSSDPLNAAVNAARVSGVQRNKAYWMRMAAINLILLGTVIYFFLRWYNNRRYRNSRNGHNQS